MMKLHQLRAVAEVAKAGSIQRAANAMNISQPALSRAIRELELQLGVPLVVRGTSGTTVTDFGAILCRRFAAVQKEMDTARDEIEWLKGTLGGRILVGVTPPATGTNLGRILADFRRRHPSVDLELLELRPAQIFDALRSGVMDLGVVHHYGAIDPAGLRCAPLKSFATILAIGGADTEPPSTIEAIWEREWITSDLADHPAGYISALADNLGLAMPERIFRCTSISAYFELAEQPQLLSHWADAISPYLDMKFAAGQLTKLAPPFPLPDMQIALISRDEELLAPGGALLARTIRSSLA